MKERAEPRQRFPRRRLIQRPAERCQQQGDARRAAAATAHPRERGGQSACCSAGGRQPRGEGQRATCTVRRCYGPFPPSSSSSEQAAGRRDPEGSFSATAAHGSSLRPPAACNPASCRAVPCRAAAGAAPHSPPPAAGGGRGRRGAGAEEGSSLPGAGGSGELCPSPAIRRVRRPSSSSLSSPNFPAAGSTASCSLLPFPSPRPPLSRPHVSPAAPLHGAGRPGSPRLVSVLHPNFWLCPSPQHSGI